MQYIIILWDNLASSKMSIKKHNQVANVQNQNNSFNFGRLQIPDAYLQHFAVFWKGDITYHTICVRFVYIPLLSVLPVWSKFYPFPPLFCCAMLCQGTAAPPARQARQATPSTRHCNCCCSEPTTFRLTASCVPWLRMSRLEKIHSTTWKRFCKTSATFCKGAELNTN